MRGLAATLPEPGTHPTPAPGATVEQPLPSTHLGFSSLQANICSHTFFKQNTPDIWPSLGKTLPGSADPGRACREAAGREKTPCAAKFISARLPNHSKSNAQNFSLRGNAPRGDLPYPPPVTQAPAPGGSSAPWAPGLSASSPAAPRLPWGLGMVPPYLRAPYHSRAHPTVVPSRRTFAECLQVARQRSGELIFLLIKGRKISLFLNRGKTTEGRAQKLFLS